MMEQMYWAGWSEKVQHRKLTGLVLAMLEGAGPVRYILSQGMLAFLPFLNSSNTPSWKAFAEMLEDPADTRSFAAFLREEKQ